MDEYRLHPSLVSFWKEGALQPWPEAAAATETVWFPLPEEPDGNRYWEGLNGRFERDGTVTVLAVPAYAYDLNLGDRVAVIASAEGPLVATGVAHRANNHTFRTYLLDPADETAWYRLGQELALMGCLVDVLSARWAAFSCPSKAFQLVAERLEQMREEGTLEYELSAGPP